jgi:hypothetical protein
VKYKVTKPYEPEGTESIVVSKGGKLRYKRKPTAWSGWIWCIASTGEAAWVPESWVKIDGDLCEFSRDYDSTELSVRKGEVLELELEESGWAWVRNSAGDYGWVPADRIEPEHPALGRCKSSH